MPEAEKAVLKTIVYYDCLDYPLTFEELDKFSFINPYSGAKSENIEEGLRNLARNGLIEENPGFYFLKGRKKLIENRKERNKLAESKWKRAFGAVWLLRIVPYIRIVFGSGSLALNNTDKESDLDVLIVTKSGRIWTARFLTVVLLGLFGLKRKRDQKIAPDKVCLNHFITDKSLYIPRKSIYTAQLYARLVPILVDDRKLFDDFCEANEWVEEWMRGWPECLLANSEGRIVNSGFLYFIKKTGEKILDTKFGNWLESVLRKYQLRRINNFHLTNKPGGRVKADDESLEFHPDSPELRIIERYNKTMVKLGFPELGREQDSGLLRGERP